MIGRDEPHDDEFSSAEWEDTNRTWQHPSEVGLASRGSVDRRRTSKIASVVLVGGLALLASTVMIGRASEPRLVATSDDAPSLPPAVVAVSTSLDDEVHVAAGIVIDDLGHVAVDPATMAAALDGSTTVWVERHDGKERPAEVLGTDPGSGLVVLRADDPAASAAMAAKRLTGDERLTIVAPTGHGLGEIGAAGVSTTATVELLASLSTGSRTIDVTVLDGRSRTGAWLFDERGDLAGVAAGDEPSNRQDSTPGTTLQVRTGASVLASTRAFAAGAP